MSCPSVVLLILCPFVLSRGPVIALFGVCLFFAVMVSPWCIFMMFRSPLVVWALMVLGSPVVLAWVSMVVVFITMMVTSIVVSGGWLSSHWGHVGGVVEVSMHVVVVIWLHLEDEVSLLDVSLGGTESSTVGIESGVVTLVPSLSVEGVEVILPVEVEASSLLVVVVSLNVVVEEVPWHVLGVEALAPGLESGCPEVHHDGLSLVHVSDGWVSSLDSSDLLVVKAP
jgi:hypothetical protein